MEKIRIYMKCSEEQYKKIKPILKKHNVQLGTIIQFNTFNYLVVDKDSSCVFVTNTLVDYDNGKNKTIYDTWDETFFLNACGIYNANSLSLISII